jgi:hypothetical protein
MLFIFQKKDKIMKKLFLSISYIVSATQIYGAAFNYPQEQLKQFADSLDGKESITLDSSLLQCSNARIRMAEPSLILQLSYRDPITSKTYRELIKESLAAGRPYELGQLITFNPLYKPTSAESIIDLKGVISTFVDDAAFSKALETEKTAIDRFGSNLEIEQTQKWLIPSICDGKIIGDAVLDRKDSWENGYTPMVPEDPASVPTVPGYIALINPNVEVVQFESKGQVFPYLIDIAQLTPAMKAGGEIIRATKWDDKSKKATFILYDKSSYISLLNQYQNKLKEGSSKEDLRRYNWSPEQFFKIQKFVIDPNNQKKAHLVEEAINDGYYGRGKYNFNDANFYSDTVMRPTIQPDNRAYYTRRARHS